MTDRSDAPLAELLLEHQGFLRRCARELVGDVEADDLVQEAFVAALEHPDAEPRSLRGWLRGLLRHKRSNELDKRRRREARERRVAREEQVEDSVDARHEVEARLELVRDVASAIEALPEAYREVVYLRTYEDLSPATIAARLDIPRNTVQSRLRRGKQLVRERLDRETTGGRRVWAVGLLAVVGWHESALPSAAASKSLLSGEAALGTAKTGSVAAAAVAFVAGAWFLGPWSDEGLRDATGDGARVALAAEPRVEDGLRAASTGLADRANGGVLASSLGELVGGTLLLEFLHHGDAAPAVGLLGHALNEGGTSVDFELDERGRARLDDVPSGKWIVYLHGFTSWTTQVAEGETKTFSTVLADGLDVRGRVLDEHDRQVAGAEVFHARSGDLPGDWTVAVTDELGWFTVRDLAPWRASGPYTELAARKDGYSSSRRWEANGREGASEELVLRLEGGAARVRGRVLDAEGAPVADAELEFWDRRNSPAYEVSEEGVSLARPPIHGLVTDAQGRFETKRLAPGRVLVTVHSSHHPMHSMEVDLDAGPNEAFELRLPEGGRITGVVRDGAGAPIEGASLSTLLPHRYRGNRRSAVTDASGRYTLEDLCESEVRVAVGSDVHAHRFDLVAVRNGATTIHDVVLASATSRAGVLVDGRGRPLAEHVVVVVEPHAPSLWITNATTASDGTFLLERIPAGPKALEVRLPDPYETSALLSLPWTDGEDDLELVVPLENLPSATLRARIVDASGAPVGNAELWLGSAGNWGEKVFSDLITGEVAFEDLVPGTYELSISAPRHVGFHQGELELAAREVHDLGDVVLATGGRLTVRLDTVRLDTVRLDNVRLDAVDPTSSASSPSVELVSEATGERRLLTAIGGRVTSELLEPGRYEVRVSGAAVALVEQAVTIVEDETTSLELTLDRGVDRRFTLPPGCDPNFVSIEVFGPDGEPFHGFSFAHGNALGLHGLTLGTWHLVVRASDDRTAERTFEVTDLLPPSESIPLDWSPRPTSR